ncbi:GNAT family N-acetyltransferase [Prosthecomicrobium sp. N25]|uniref:GNAT family N-acetyltransferase n=1 Tax=Prosthecomicrobium sp. N25 TaxID=3129254 RepID=UPI003077E181
MSTPFEIRLPRSDEYEPWLALWEGYNAFYERKGPTAVSEAVTRTTWGRFFDASEPVHCLVAAAGDRLIGLTHYLYHRNTVMIGPTCYMQDLFTAPEARGRGVATALIQAVYARAREAGAPRVYWQTHETNLTAQRLYDTLAQRSGFIVYRKDL